MPQVGALGGECFLDDLLRLSFVFSFTIPMPPLLRDLYLPFPFLFPFATIGAGVGTAEGVPEGGDD